MLLLWFLLFSLVWLVGGGLCFWFFLLCNLATTDISESKGTENISAAEEVWDGGKGGLLGGDMLTEAASHLKLCPIPCASNQGEIRALGMEQSGCSCSRSLEGFVIQQSILWMNKLLVWGAGVCGWCWGDIRTVNSIYRRWSRAGWPSGGEKLQTPLLEGGAVAVAALK